MEEYEINAATLAIIPLDEETSKVYELEEEYVVNKSSNSIIRESCAYYGSSYKGRCEGTKFLTGIKAKYPIIVEESRNIIFFPTASSRTAQCCWIALNQIKSYDKHKKVGRISFMNNKKIDLDISYYSLENQICRAIMLKSKLYERKLEDID